MERWPLSGRVEEQAFLSTVITDPEQTGALIAGRAGVGKTRLMREVVEAARDCHAEFVTATESARPLPFGAFAHLLPEDLGGIDRVDLLAVIGRHLVRRAEGRPLILAVDDMHLLDAFSAALAHHVATTRLGTVLLTMRSGETAPDAVMALHRDGIVARLDLQPISRSEFDLLVEAALESPTEVLTLDRIWAVTQGNVLFARELIGDALSAGTLSQERGIWRWSGHFGVVPRLQEAVAARLGDLAAAEQRLLELLAVGEPLSLPSAQRLAPEASVPDLERRGLLVAELLESRSEVRLAHPLFGEVIRLALPVSQLRQINHDLADDLSREGLPGEGGVLRLAILREAAGEEVDPVVLVQAAATANVFSDHQLAERLARTSITAGGGFDAELELGRALLGQNRFAETEAVLTPLLGHEPSDTSRIVLADTISQAVGYGLGRLDEAVEILKSVELCVTDPVTRALLQGIRAGLLSFGAHFAEAAELGMSALRSVEDEGVRLQSLASVNTSLTMAGRLDESLALCDAALEPALRLQDRFPRAPGWVVGTRSTALFFAGRADEALLFVDSALRNIPNAPPEFVANANGYRGRFHLALGRPLSAARLFDDAVLTAREDPTVVEPSWCLALSAEASALLNQHEQASALAAESISLRRTAFLATYPDELRALSWVDAQAGRTSSAIDQLWIAVDFAESQGQRSWEIIILGDLLRLGEVRAAERAREVAQHVDGAWSAAVVAHALAALSLEAGDVETAAKAFSSMGSSLVAAEMWAIASSRHQRAGLPVRAAAASRQSAALVEVCEGARTEPLSWAVDQAPLTRRERESVNLAANGVSNAQIAADLSISVRTVESHLYAAFAKLGITDRSQLSCLFEKG